MSSIGHCYASPESIVAFSDRCGPSHFCVWSFCCWNFAPGHSWGIPSFAV